ncbi:Zinc finger BED domain-containing protein 1 [Melipona quadrifasciata]|uniref:Zinc finger BED domain-containing protein 1 n=1 Tax=Melipona quadrifasciata TaxID=166423 RepID=A0A0N0BBX9_9HYME|nr:Zinc finger BED domain-containing protein 1 [Melipona quadrifasciata]
MESKPITLPNSGKSATTDDSKSEMQMVLAKMMEEKYTYTYKKLVVPMSMRSIYWKFFGFPATDDGDILTKVKIVCILCKTQIAYNRNTSNLRMHLQNKHAQELLELEATNPPRRQVLSQETKDRRAQKKLLKTDAIAEFIIMDLQLPEVVEGRGFQRLVATLRSPCEIPSKNKLEEEIIPKIYDTFRESVATTLSCITSEVGLTIEEWKSNSDEKFVTVSVYYQNSGEPVLECKVLSTIHAPLDWEESHWGNMIDSLLLDWDLKIERITAVVVATSRVELLNALTNRGLTLVPCLLYTLQVCAQACFDSPEVATILSKCRAAIGVIISHPAASAALAMQEQLLELEENAMLMDYPPIWTSTYNMLEQMVLRRNIVTSILESMEGIDQEVVDLTNDQWKIIEDLVNVLEPFKVTIMTLSEEKMPLISLLKPLLWQLVSSHLKIKESDSEKAKAFKESLSDMLCDRYADYNVTLLLQIATTLDPRFKQLPYATEEDKNSVATDIKEMLTKLIQEESGDNINIKVEEEPLTKKSRVSGMEFLLGGLCSIKSGMPAEEKADLELVQYHSESTAPLDYCPLQWWAKISAKCPNLGKLACKYNCVPACCAPPSRIPAEIQVLYDTRRTALPPHLIDKLLFLHGNHTV